MSDSSKQQFQNIPSEEDDEAVAISPDTNRDDLKMLEEERSNNRRIRLREMKSFASAAFTARHTQMEIAAMRCGCGRDVTDHEPIIAAEAEIGEWKSEVDTIKKPSSRRQILFPLNETDGNRATPAWYLRLADDTDIELVAGPCEPALQNICFHDILLSFIGGCGNDFISKSAEDALTDAVSQILNNFDSLFFTRASELGLAKLVGRLSKSYTPLYKRRCVHNCVGFMPWGCVAGREQLECGMGSDLIRYNCPVLSSDIENQNYVLDHNHHIFYLTDDGSINRFGSECKIRSKLHHFMVCQEKKPSANILVGGGLSSIASVHKGLFPDHELEIDVVIPVVVLKNSGRAADVFSYVFKSDARKERYKERKYKKYRTINLMLATKIAAVKYLDLDLTEMKSLKSLALVRECIENQKNKVFICDVENITDNLYDIILTAALEVSYANSDEQILSEFHQCILTLSLQDVERTRKLMQRSPDVANDIMYEALLRCQVGLVEDLLELYNFSIEDFLPKRITHPYFHFQHGNPFKDAHGGRFVIETVSKKFPWVLWIDTVDGISVTGERNLCQFMNDMLQAYTDENLAMPMKQDGRFFIYDDKKINATQAMMINCIIINQPPLTKVFWKYDKYNPLSNALLAFKLQSAFADLYDDTVPRALQTSIEYFQEKIVQLLTCYYETDEELAAKVLSRKIPMWKGQTLIDVAGDLEFKFFIEQPASQLVLSKAWKGEDPERSEFLKDLEAKSKQKSLVGWIYLVAFVINKYLGTPTTKLILHVVMYLISIGMFSFYVLVKKSSADVAIKWIMFVMVCSVALDEFRQVFDHKKHGWLNFKRWASSPWNLLDASCITLFFTGFILSFFEFHLSKDIFSVFLCLWCIKVTQYLRISSTLGPYMVMIFQMLAHIKTFLAVLIIAIIGYGMFMTAMLFPNLSASWHTLFKVLFRPYLLVFGEMGLESHELSSTKTVFGTPKISRLAEIAVVIGMAVFLMLANVVLLNLLIAAFSNIYEDVEARSYQIWKFEQYQLLKEFQNKPVLPFPYSLPENVYLLFNIHPVKRKRIVEETSFNEIEERELADFERSCLMKIWADLFTDEKLYTKRKKDHVMESLEKSKMETMGRIERNAKAAIDQKEQLRKSIDVVREDVFDRLEKIDKNIDERLARLEDMILKISGRDSST